MTTNALLPPKAAILDALMGECDPVALPMLERMLERERRAAEDRGRVAGIDACLEILKSELPLFRAVAAIARLKEVPPSDHQS